jgi:hypothetical protein
MTTIEHKLSIFGGHVQTLQEARPGDTFALGFWGDVYIRVHVSGTMEDGRLFHFTQGDAEPSLSQNEEGTWFLERDEDHYLDTMCVGNIHGAYQQYANLCAPAFREYSDEIIDAIGMFEMDCQANDYTDTERAWELLNWIRDTLRADKGRDHGQL